MGIEKAIHPSETKPILWEGKERRGQGNKERFPWEHGSPRDMWRGRIGTLLAGAFLTWLIVLSNPKTITALQDETRHVAGAFELRSTRVSGPIVQAVRLEPASVQSPPLIPPGNQPFETSPPRVQLGSYTSEAEAVAALDVLRQSYGTSLEGRKLTISEAVIRQVQFYRVVVDLQSEREARDLCDAIKKEKRDCLVWTRIKNAN